jgi:hypothetical protein
MACSCFLGKLPNIQQEDLVYSIQKFRLKQLFRSGKLRRRGNDDESKNLCQRGNVMKHWWKSNDTQLIRKRVQSRNEFETRMSYHFSNIPILLKMNNSYSNLLAKPFEVFLSENMPSNLRGETIPMTCSCFFGKSWNNQRENLIYSVQKCRLKHSFRSGKLRRREEIQSIWMENNTMRKEFEEIE